MSDLNVHKIADICTDREKDGNRKRKRHKYNEIPASFLISSLNAHVDVDIYFKRERDGNREREGAREKAIAIQRHL